jgi:hypothetical protein
MEWMNSLLNWLSVQAYYAEYGDAQAQVIVGMVKALGWGMFALIILTIAMWICLPWALRTQKQQLNLLIQEQRLTNFYLDSMMENLRTMSKNSITLISRKKDEPNT